MASFLRHSRVVLRFAISIIFITHSGFLQRVSMQSVKDPSASQKRSAVPNLGIGASLNGVRPFPATNAWNQDVSHLPVHPNSANLIASIGNTTGLHPDFGTFWEGAPIGIPYMIVSGSQQKVPINFTSWPGESDPGPYPFPANAPIEGGANSGGDRHVLVIDRDNWKLYETFSSYPINNGASWNAASGAVWNLNSNAVRTPGWTSADAAGLPIFPGLVRRDEILAGEIRHAFRFTAVTTRTSYVYPATHSAGSTSSQNAPPMGMRVRLKANFNISTFPPNVQVILRALKKYGMILADNGSNWYISGTHDPLWNDDELSSLSRVKGSDFEVVAAPDHPLTPIADFDADGVSDVSVFRASDGGWYTLRSGGGYSVTSWGTTGDVPVPGDYDGDGKVDTAMFRPSTGQWFILHSLDSSIDIVNWGNSTDTPLPFDFDGDGRSDIAVYRPSSGQWFILKSINGSADIVSWGNSTDKPVPGDYDGDSKTDIAVYRPSSGMWYVLASAGGGWSAPWGTVGDIPFPIDYDGDGKDDLTAYRPSLGNWYVYRSSDQRVDVANWGSGNDIPVPADYDGDGREDFAVYRSGTWYCLHANGGALVANWGIGTDSPIPSKYFP